MENLKQIILDGVNTPEYLELLEVIQNKKELQDLFKKYPKTFDNEDKIKKLSKIFKEWVLLNDEIHTKVICLYQDPDDFGRNDSWGHKEIYLVIVVKSGKGFTVVGQKVEGFDLE